MRRFDQEHYDALSAACGDVARQLVPEFKESLSPKTALYLGCGLGYFADLLNDVGLKALAIDGRCYATGGMPAHPDYHSGSNGFRRRVVVIGSKVLTDSPFVTPWPDSSVIATTPAAYG